MEENQNKETPPQQAPQPMEHKTIISPSDSFIQEINTIKSNEAPNDSQDPNQAVDTPPPTPQPLRISDVELANMNQPTLNPTPQSFSSNDIQSTQPLTTTTSTPAIANTQPQVFNSVISNSSNDNNSSPNHDGPIYSSNPFVNLSQGLSRILLTNPISALLSSVFIFLIIIIVYAVSLLIISSSLHHASPKLSSGSFLLYGLLATIIDVLIGSIIIGLISYIAAASFNGETKSFGSSLAGSLKKIVSVFVLEIVFTIIACIGLILLIIPGIIFISRSYLAFIIMFDEQLGPIESLKKSISLTKNHTFEMLATYLSTVLFSGGLLLMGPIFSAQLVGRYSQLKQIENNQSEAKTHWLNYALPFIYLAIIGLFIGISAFLIITLGHSLGTKLNNPIHSNTTQSSLNNQTFTSNSTGQANIQQITGFLNEYMATNNSYPATKLSLENWLMQPGQSSLTLANALSNSMYHYSVSPKGCGDTISVSGTISSNSLKCTSFSLYNSNNKAVYTIN